MIECTSKRGGAFDADDKFFIDIFASITAATLDALRLVKTLRARTESGRAHSGGSGGDEGSVLSVSRESSGGTASAAGSSRFGNREETLKP